MIAAIIVLMTNSMMTALVKEESESSFNDIEKNANNKPTITEKNELVSILYMNVSSLNLIYLFKSIL